MVPLQPPTQSFEILDEVDCDGVEDDFRLATIRKFSILNILRSNDCTVFKYCGLSSVVTVKSDWCNGTNGLLYQPVLQLSLTLQ